MWGCCLCLFLSRNTPPTRHFVVATFHVTTPTSNIFEVLPLPGRLQDSIFHFIIGTSVFSAREFLTLHIFSARLILRRLSHEIRCSLTYRYTIEFILSRVSVSTYSVTTFFTDASACAHQLFQAVSAQCLPACFFCICAGKLCQSVVPVVCDDQPCCACLSVFVIKHCHAATVARQTCRFASVVQRRLRPTHSIPTRVLCRPYLFSFSKQSVNKRRVHLAVAVLATIGLVPFCGSDGAEVLSKRCRDAKLRLPSCWWGRSSPFVSFRKPFYKKTHFTRGDDPRAQTFTRFLRYSHPRSPTLPFYCRALYLPPFSLYKTLYSMPLVF